MKKNLLLILFTLLFSQYGYSVERITNDDEKIDIVEEPKINPKEDRSIKNVECYLSRSENTISVEYSGIGIPLVYILDINGNILSYHQSNSITNNITVSLPHTEGTYNVLIQSQVYSGIGVFNIY